MKLLDIFSKPGVDQESSATAVYYIDELALRENSVRLAGWLFHPALHLESLILRDQAGACHSLDWLPSPDVAIQHGPRARQSRFQITVDATFKPNPSFWHLEARIRGTNKRIQVPIQVTVDPYHRLFSDFFSKVNDLENPSVLEIGSRARSGNVHSSRFGSHVDCTGIDIVPGENVDVVRDAHNMSQLFSDTKKFDAIFSISVFEHLAMPWKVVLECNKLLAPSGLVFVASHQTWPLHDAPWDFWRFSDSAWRSLFNSATGFKVLQSAMGIPGSISPISRREAALRGLSNQPAFLGTAVIAQKVGATNLEWAVDTNIVVEGFYPH